MAEFYIENEHLFAVSQLMLAMFGMGATLTLGDFKAVLVTPKAFIVGMVLQLLLVPLAGYLFIQGFSLEAGVAAGIAICVAIPGGSVSNIYTMLAKGNVPLSIALSGVTTFACLITTPIILSLLASSYLPENFSMPAGQIAKEIVYYLLLPLSAGMFFLKLFPLYSEVFSKWAIRASMLVIVLMVVGASMAGRIDYESLGIKNIILINLFLYILIFVSFLVPKIMQLGGEKISAINIEVTVRNISLGVLIKVLLFPLVLGQADPIGDMVLFVLLFYGGVQLFAGLVVVWFAKYKIGNLYR